MSKAEKPLLLSESASDREKRKSRNKLADYLVYVALRVVDMTLKTYPVWFDLMLAQGMGAMWWKFNRKHRDRTMANLRRSFPAASTRTLERIGRASHGGFMKLAVEMMFTTRLIRLDSFTRHIQLDNFGDTLKLLLQPGKGLIVLTGHYGNWEVLGYTLAVLGFDTLSVSRPLDNPYLQKWALGVREAKGQRMVHKTGATPHVTAMLESGGVVGFIADQNAGPKGMFVDFFGRKASTYKSIGLLAMQYDVPIVIGYARRLDDDFHFKVGTQDVIYPADWKREDNPLEYITQRYTKAIEDFIRADPSQYLWTHRRWKTRPKGEAAEAFD